MGEQKYVAEEKEFAATIHKEQMSQNLISQSQTQELSQDANNVITERSEARQEFLHEDMKKMSIEEKTTMRIADEAGRMAEDTETTVTGAETSANEAADLKTGANDTTSEHGF